MLLRSQPTVSIHIHMLVMVFGNTHIKPPKIGGKFGGAVLLSVHLMAPTWGLYQGIGKDVPRAQCTRSWEIPPKKTYFSWVFMGYNPQSLQNTINTMGTLLGVHPIVP